MQADQYLQAIINRHRLPDDDHPPAPPLQNWSFYKHIESITLSGSRAKSTALRGSDLDFFISLNADTPGELETIQQSLAAQVHGQIRNVSVRIIQNNVQIDLVPARANTLWQFRWNTCLKTNISEQIRHILSSGRQNEIRLLKLWRKRHALKFPSFLLELAVIRALPKAQPISTQFPELLDYLATTFPKATLTDPANPNNIVSALLSPDDKSRIAQTAADALSHQTWQEILE